MKLNELIDRLCNASASDPREVLDVVVGGNPAMLQIAAGMDPAPLGEYPFETSINGGTAYGAGVFGFNVNAQARAYVPPVAHAFVGSDISAGLSINPGAFFAGSTSSLFVDIGTNGELALNSRGTCLVTSAAAGPALEGMGISCGMQAVPGAVERVFADRGTLRLGVIGGLEPAGLCGSGVIELTSALLALGLVEASGRLVPPSRVPHGAINLRQPADREGWNGRIPRDRQSLVHPAGHTPGAARQERHPDGR